MAISSSLLQLSRLIIILCWTLARIPFILQYNFVLLFVSKHNLVVKIFLDVRSLFCPPAKMLARFDELIFLELTTKTLTKAFSEWQGQIDINTLKGLFFQGVKKWEIIRQSALVKGRRFSASVFAAFERRYVMWSSSVFLPFEWPATILRTEKQNYMLSKCIIK